MSEIPSNITDTKTNSKRQLNKAEKALYKRLKGSFEQIKSHQEGKITLKTIEEVLVKLSR